MFLHVIKAKYIEDYKIEISFSDGKTGIADLFDSLKGDTFVSLKNTEEFSKFTVDRELETIVWPNGADFAPEYLYFRAFKDKPHLKSRFKEWGYLD